MTQAIKNKTSYKEGYQDGILRSIAIVNSFRNVDDISRVSVHLTMSVIVDTLTKLANGDYDE